MLEDISPEALHAGQLGAVPTAGGPLVVVQDTLVRLQHLCIEAAKRRAEGESDIWARLAPTLVTRVLQEHSLTCAVVLVADKPALTTPLKQATQQKRAQSRAKLARERKLPPPEQIQRTCWLSDRLALYCYSTSKICSCALTSYKTQGHGST
eukprot:g60960.t1